MQNGVPTLPLGQDSKFPGGLDRIETDWSMIHEPAHLVMRYSRAIESYFRALIKNHHDAEEAAQNFFLWISQNGLPRACRDRGRFRDYLKVVVRNAALHFLRSNHPPVQNESAIAQVASHEETPGDFDREWVTHWRRCILKGVWRRLREDQANAPDSTTYAVMRLCAAFPNERSTKLAEKLAAKTNKPIGAAAFRQKVSRARRQFAQYLVDEVAQTLSDPAPADVEGELADLGLISYVRSYLPLRRRMPPS